MESLDRLIHLIRKLRAPDGCPWDRQQKKEDIGKFMLEEAYEAIDALEKNNPEALKEELGDVLFQILFICEICAESGLFSLEDVMDGVNEKMIRRHPHVFGTVKVTSVQDVKDNWQQIKKKERKETGREKSLFSSIPRSLPALKRAQKITALASQSGFDWKDIQGVRNKLQEEWQEFEAAVKSENRIKTEEELGDILFTMVNLSRFLRVDAETALSKTTDKFLRRFAHVTEQLSSRGLKPEEATLQQMDALWDEAKKKD